MFCFVLLFRLFLPEFSGFEKWFRLIYTVYDPMACTPDAPPTATTNKPTPEDCSILSTLHNTPHSPHLLDATRSSFSRSLTPESR